MADSSIDAVSLGDVMSVKDASERLGLTYYQMRWRMRRGVIKRVILPNGYAVVLRSSVEAYAASHELGQ